MRSSGAITRVRRELRERLMADRTDGVAEMLARLATLAEDDDDLLGEVARWTWRFELLAHATA
jgi:hypothetical protein